MILLDFVCAQCGVLLHQAPVFVKPEPECFCFSVGQKSIPPFAVFYPVVLHQRCWNCASLTRSFEKRLRIEPLQATAASLKWFQHRVVARPFSLWHVTFLIISYNTLNLQWKLAPISNRFSLLRTHCDSFIPISVPTICLMANFSWK